MPVMEPSPRISVLSDFQERLHIVFSDLTLLDSALTHRSFLNEASRSAGLSHNERLEFLGDAVLGQVVASLLYSRLEGRPEGELARVKSIVVSEHTLAPMAARIGLAEVLQLGRGEELSGGRAKKALLADALEALMGALFLEHGYESANRFVAELMRPAIDMAIAGQSKDFKTIIQEYAQKHLGTLPAYRLEISEGPEHDRLFCVSCTLEQEKYGPFSGKTKKEAEQAAAEFVYNAIKQECDVAAQRLSVIARLQQ